MANGAAFAWTLASAIKPSVTDRAWSREEIAAYRDPIASREDPLSSEEEELKKSTLKEHFFETLAQMKGYGQVVVLENVDPPTSVETLAHVHIIHRRGRRGAPRVSLSAFLTGAA